MNPYYLFQPLRRYFRRRRLKDFAADHAECRTILDFGGDHIMWDTIGHRGGITLLNIRPPTDIREGFHYVSGSALAAPFADKSFDLAFANSAIEHVGSEANQFRFAAEMMRVGKRVYCQTPSRLFPVDPHLSTPFVHWLPQSWQTPRFLRYFTVNGWLIGKPYDPEVTWISKRKLRKMFPGCRIRTERFLLLPKSFIVTN